MKAYEFPTKVTPEGKLEIPEPLVKLLASDQVVRVILLVSEPVDSGEQATWARLTTEQFFAGYDEADSVYDNI